MKLSEQFKKKNVVFSFEIFPPKATSSIDTLYDTLAALQDLQPDFISVTYGAGGNIADNRTVELSSLVKNKYNIESLAHLTCISSSIDTIDHILGELQDKNVHNILALRGDVPKDSKPVGEFNYATELITYTKQRTDFGIAAACYPEGHNGDGNLEKEVDIIKLKRDAGADSLMTQLFFDNNTFYNFMDLIAKNGIETPIQAGIMPVTNRRQIERTAAMCGAKIPVKFLKIIERYEHDKQALRDAGIAYATEQIIDLIASGVQGIHLYTMNNPYVARKISENISTVLSSANATKAALDQ